jgi:thiosulfate reductase cytochrome b subunit
VLVVKRHHILVRWSHWLNVPLLLGLILSGISIYWASPICSLGFPFAKFTHREWLHPRFNTKYNALQRAAYLSVPVAGFLSVATGWAIHKPMQLYWLAELFGGFDASRLWLFRLMRPRFICKGIEDAELPRSDLDRMPFQSRFFIQREWLS